MRHSSRFVLSAFAAATMAASCVGEAMALDAYWHGVRSFKWGDGVNGGISNWYSKPPPNGKARNVPDGMAIFAPGAARLEAQVDGKRTIKEILFTNGGDEYDIFVDPNGKLLIKGPGVQNDSSVIQVIAADSTKSQVAFKGKSVACIKPGKKTILGAKAGGNMLFTGKSIGNRSCIVDVRTDGKARFLGRSSAGKMRVESDGGNASIQFLGRSTGGKAIIKNYLGMLFFNSAGPAGDGKITAKSIDNRSEADIGVNEVSLGGKLDLTGTSKTTFSFTGTTTHGAILAKANATVGGEIVVKGSPTAKPGKYTLIGSNKAVVGTFGTETLSGFGANLTASIKYVADAVQLVIKKN